MTVKNKLEEIEKLQMRNSSKKRLYMNALSGSKQGFSMYLEDVARREIKGTTENLDTGETCEVLITASMVCSSSLVHHISPIGFNPNPTMQLFHEAPGRKMSANTCTNNTLPFQ